MKEQIRDDYSNTTATGAAWDFLQVKVNIHPHDHNVTVCGSRCLGISDITYSFIIFVIHPNSSSTQLLYRTCQKIFPCITVRLPFSYFGEARDKIDFIKYITFLFQLKCCGGDGVPDYQNSKWWNTTKVLQICLSHSLNMFCNMVGPVVP